ncbi:choloylglycine hydrolase family protein [Roseixanthobacter liquoris]|uniref:choloylglycine hydrolase family protein n=1 Tax=Roseixanthobacter liquoris TaxID=3119921 RepID=UPI0037274784
MLLRTLLSSVCVIATLNVSLACTAVDVVAGDGTVVAGRTMEWGFDMKWNLVSKPAGTPLALTAPPALKLPTNTIKTKYAVVGVAPGILPGAALLEGQNSAGLGMSANFLPGFTQYQTVTPADRNYVSVLDFGTWALGTNATVAEVKTALQTTKVWFDAAALGTGDTPMTLHLVFTDKTGASVVAEYVGGDLRLYDNVAHVLTNAPTYDWHLLNARNYLNLSTVGVQSVQIGTANVTALGQGGGTIGIPGDYTPPARFIRAAFMRHNETPPATGTEAVQAVGHILNTVDIPLGVAQSREGNQLVSDYTQFVAIKDLSHNRLMITDYNHRLIFLTLDLNTIFAQDQPTSIPIADLPYPKSIDATSSLMK